jgi:NADPH-dependent 2,4-dienoyl-CoA reductase/sulfur reductase-like enzyme/rhodanese-related sulfurtransferase
MSEPEPNRGDALRFAALVAHQLRSPVAAAASLLQTVRGGFAGPLTDKQRDLLARADERCRQALESVRRMLAIGRAMEGSGTTGQTADVAKAARVAAERWQAEATRHGLALQTNVVAGSACVPVAHDALTEVFDALLGNAVKYTPEHGRIRLTVSCDDPARAVRVSVADSGIGVPEADRARVFEPFARAASAQRSSRPGVGLGLAFVKAVIEAGGGHVEVRKADLGGAEFVLDLPVAEAPQTQEKGDRSMSEHLRVLIVGGVAAGPKVASKIMRLRPEADVTIVERGEFLSYAGCGLPYYVSGVVKEQKELMCTPVGTLRDPVFFHNVKNFRALNQTEAVAIDRPNKRVRVRSVLNGEDQWLEYDKLVLATGATPVVPPIPGVKLANVFTLHGVHDAEGIRAALAESKARDVTIVGGGLIGVEATEALAEHGCRVTIVEMLPQILRILDWEMAKLVERHLESRGVKVLTGNKVTSFQGNGRVERVVTERGAFPADLVILAIGVRPNVELARSAGLEIGQTGGIRASDRMVTSDPDIYAAGDCVEMHDMLTGRPCYVPLGSTANKQGRVAAVNICGGDERFPGVIGSTVCKVFEYCVARTGLTEGAALDLGHKVVTVLAPAPDKAHYMPTAKPLLLKLVVHAQTRRLLGAQATGPGDGAKRIDVAAMAITAGMTVDQLANADLCYAPPYAPAMDNLITAANVARNKLDGYMVGVTPMEVKRMLDEKEDFVFLDVRTPGEYEQVRLPDSTLIPLGALRGRLDELPRDKPIVTFCKVSLRGYEAALILKAAGFQNLRVMDGGIAMWPYETVR